MTSDARNHLRGRLLLVRAAGHVREVDDVFDALNQLDDYEQALREVASGDHGWAEQQRIAKAALNGNDA